MVSPEGMLFLEHPHYRAPYHVVIFSINNWLACGIGFAFAGSIVLALGLIGKPREYAARVIRSGNTSLRDNIDYAENKADAQIGIFALAVGFGIQAITTVWMTGHAARLGSGFSYFVTIGWVVLPIVVVWVVDRKTRWNRARRYLIELARYDRGETPTRYPNINELTRYGNIFNDQRKQRQDEPAEEYAKRVWNIDQIRTH